MDEPIRSSYHTHSHYCDGKGEIAEMIEAAIAAGISDIGISSHAPLPFATEWTMPPERLVAYTAEVRELQQRYRDRIRVRFGLEIDYIPSAEVAAFQESTIFPLGFDYFVGSVHFLGHHYPPGDFDGSDQEFRKILDEAYAGDMAAMVSDYYQRMSQVPTIPGVKIVGHLDRIKRWNTDHRYFSGDEAWYREAVERALQSLAASGTIVELNTSGWRNEVGEQYPSLSILTRCHDLGIPITVNSDAHSPGDVVAGFEQARDLLARIGIVPVSLE